MARYAKFFSVGAGGGGTNNLQLPIGTVLDTVLRQVQDGAGTGSPLYLSTYRVGITSDSSVTTQTSSVIQATTTNANLVIAPNGTGALVAQIPDGTVAGGNARGVYAVDLQMGRNNIANVASGNNATIGGGYSNKASGLVAPTVAGGQYNFATGLFWPTVGGGSQNIASGQASTVSGGQLNTASSDNSVISGGQSNTASSSSHATVVGGLSNTSSGQYSVSGGNGNSSTSTGSISFGSSNISSGGNSFTMCNSNTASGIRSFAIGGLSNTASSDYAINLGGLGCLSSSEYTITSGNRTYSYLFGQKSHSGISFSTTRGEVQESTLTANREATLTTGGTTTLSLDGTGTTNLIIPNGTNRMWNVQVAWVAVVTAITGTATGVTVGDTKVSTDLLAVAKRAGVTTVSAHTSAATHAIETIAGSLTAANITYSAGASQQMAITFTGPTFAGGGSVTMRVVAKVQLTEVAY
jgi:hypothetical protein